MAANKYLIGVIRAATETATGTGDIRATLSRTDINIDIDYEERRVIDVTSEAAKAMIGVEHERHAVPAMEQTKRAVELTKRDKQFTVRHSLVCAVVVACAAMILVNPEAGLSIVGLVTVLGGVYGWSLHINRSKDKKLDGSGDNAP